MNSLYHTILNFISWCKDTLRPSACMFTIGEVVVPARGDGHPMVVVEIHRGKKLREPILFCKWRDLQTNETRTNLFHLSDLKPFDWSAHTAV
jgi:hypothetical protein